MTPQMADVLAPPSIDAIPRSATRRSGEGANESHESRPLSHWADLDAFVLLAEPGGGKSCAFQFEADATGGAYVKARDFANVGPPQGWARETLFIDGFDEMRAASTSRDTPLNDIIRRLATCGFATAIRRRIRSAG